MNLREARIAKQGAAAVGTPYGSTVGRLGVGREIEDIRVAACCQHDYIGRMTFDVAGHQVARDNATRSAVHDHDVEQLAADMHGHRPSRHLLFQRLISPEKKLLPRLTSRIKCS